MYDNNIKLLELNELKPKIQFIDIMTESDQLITIIKTIKEPTYCPICTSNKIKFNSYRTKKSFTVFLLKNHVSSILNKGVINV